MIKYFVNSGDDKIIDPDGDDQLYGNKGKNFFHGGSTTDLIGESDINRFYGSYGKYVREGDQVIDFYNCREDYHIMVDYSYFKCDSYYYCKQIDNIE